MIATKGAPSQPGSKLLHAAPDIPQRVLNPVLITNLAGPQGKSLRLWACFLVGKTWSWHFLFQPRHSQVYDFK